MIYSQTRYSFTGGEISPWAQSRVDLDAYARSAAKLENFLVTPFGGLARRPGFEFIALACENEGDCRLYPFLYSTGDSYVLEFSCQKLRFFKKGKLLLDEVGEAYVLDTPWDTPHDLSLRQINDVVYICSSRTVPRRLERHSETQWALNVVTWKNLPWFTYEEREEPLIMEIYKALCTDDTRVYKLTVPELSSPVYAQYEGKEYIMAKILTSDRSYWFDGSKLGTALKADTPSVNLATTNYAEGKVVRYKDSTGYNAFYTCIRSYEWGIHYNNSLNPLDYPSFFQLGSVVSTETFVDGEWEFRTSGSWYGEWLLQKSYDQGKTWITARNFFSDNSNNYLTNGDESDEPCLIRILIGQAKSDANLGRVNFKILAHKTEIALEVISHSKQIPSLVTAKLLDSYRFPYDHARTYEWSYSAFGPHHGYPSCLTWHQNRLVFAGTPTLPQRIWLSKVDDFHNFKLSSLDNGAMGLDVAASSQNAIRWMHSQQELFFATSEGEWVLTSSDKKALTPSNVLFRNQSHQGAESVAPVPMENSLLYIQRGGLTVRELSYRLESDGYATSDLTIQASHITTPRVKEMTLYLEENQTLWVVKEDGECAVMKWIPGQNILSWTRQSCRDARILSLATIDNENKAQELWAIVERDIQGVKRRSIERLQQEGVMTGDREKYYPNFFPIYLDDYIIQDIDSSGACNLPHLASLEVVAYPFNDPYLPQSVKIDEEGKGRVNRGEGTEDSLPIRWIFGLPYTSLVTTLPLEQLETYGRVKNCFQTKVGVLSSYPYLEYQSEWGDIWHQAPVVWNDDSYVSEDVVRTSLENQSTSYYTGYLLCSLQMKYAENPFLSLRTESPHPLHILSLIPRLMMDERNEANA